MKSIYDEAIEELQVALRLVGGTMKRSISELEFKVESIKLELKLAKSELKNAKRLEKLRKRQEKELEK